METIILRETINEDRILHLELQLPIDAPKGQVRVTIEPNVEIVDPLQPPEGMTEAEIDALFEEALALREKYPHGQGLTPAEIVELPQVGLWKDRPETQNSVEYIARLRHRNRERRMTRE